jgi:Bardet-Biedl syndrome 4 protein
MREKSSSNGNSTNGSSAAATNTATLSTTTTITANSAVPLPTSYSIKEKRNWQIHLLYIRQSFEECLKLIELQLKDCNGLCEYPLFIKGNNAISVSVE